MKKIDKFTIVTKIESLCIIIAIIILTIRLLFSISSTSTVSNQQELSQSTTQSQQYNTVNQVRYNNQLTKAICNKYQ